MAVASLLDTIVAATRRAVEVRASAVTMAEVERSIQRLPDGRAFEEALRGSQPPRVIAECKRRSPSRGILRAEYEPAAHAVSYADAGAAAISVLTEGTFFDGSLEHLRAVRRAVALPLLRKDFVVSDYQVAEAAAAGADAVLLIVAALEHERLRTLVARAAEFGLAALVEVHDAAEISRAVDAGARIVGVNSRDLRTLTVDAGAFEAAAPLLPRDVVAVAESGIRDHADIDRLSALGFHAFLVGERLIAQRDPGSALRELRRGAAPGEAA